MNKSETIGKLAPALVKALAEMKNPPFDSKNPHFKNDYASLVSVRDTVTPILAKHDLCIVQHLGNNEAGEMTCETMILHSSGEWMASTVSMPSQQKTPQGYASTSTYLRRYGLMAICNVVGDVDDDGNAGTKEKTGNYEPEKSMTVEELVDKMATATNLFELKARYSKYAEQIGRLSGEDKVKVVMAKDKRKTAIEKEKK